jgi:hypothetical protein
MGSPMKRPSASLIALAAAAALLVAGCGGGGGADSTAPTPAQPSTASTAQSSKSAQGGSSNSHSPASTKESKPPPNLPPPTPGSKAAAPGVPTSKQGDNSIQTWGLEASDAQRAAASKAVQTYLNARAARKWGTVCQLLAAKPRREQTQFAQGASCARVMASFAANAEGSVLREEAQIEVLSFRVGKRYAFLIYRRPDGIFATALAREAGAWKLLTVTPSPLT